MAENFDWHPCMILLVKPCERYGSFQTLQHYTIGSHPNKTFTSVIILFRDLQCQPNFLSFKNALAIINVDLLRILRQWPLEHSDVQWWWLKVLFTNALRSRSWIIPYLIWAHVISFLHAREKQLYSVLISRCF